MCVCVHVRVCLCVCSWRWYLSHVSGHGPLALDLPLAERREARLVLKPAVGGVADVDGHGESVALHARGGVDGVAEKAVARHLVADHA